MKENYKLHYDALIGKIDPLEMDSFFDKVTILLSPEKDQRIISCLPEELHYLSGECSYIVDYKAKSLLYKKGFNELLGYQDDEVDFDFVFKGYHHEDAVIVSQLIKTVIASTVNSLSKDSELQLNMTFRRKRRDGSYIHLLSQTSLFELDAKGSLLKSITRLTDISYLNLITPVSWSIRSKDLDEQFIRSRMLRLFENPFTKREVEIIKEIQAGGSNLEIAKRLFVSHHTVATHRKNIFRKCNCRSIEELLLYSKRLNII